MGYMWVLPFPFIMEESIYSLIGSSAPPAVSTYVARSPQGKAQMHKVDQVGDIMNPVRGPRDEMARRGIKPVNHAAKNARAVTEQSEVQRLKKEHSQAVSKMEKPKRYSGVESRHRTKESPRPTSPGTYLKKTEGKNLSQSNTRVPQAQHP